MMRTDYALLAVRKSDKGVSSEGLLSRRGQGFILRRVTSLMGMREVRLQLELRYI